MLKQKIKHLIILSF